MQGDRGRAIVVGAGVGGLAAAVALLRIGFEVHVYETSPDLRTSEGGIHLWSNAMRSLRSLGLAESVEREAHVVQRAEFDSQAGGAVARWPVADHSREVGEPSLGISRADLQRVLRDALPADSLHLASKFVSFEQDESGVTARFADFAEEGDLLIGADGLHSSVRAQMLGDAPPRYAGYFVVQGTLPQFSDEVAPAGLFKLIYGRGARFAFYRIGGDRLYWFAVLNLPKEPATPGHVDHGELASAFAGWPEPVGQILAASGQTHYTRWLMRDRRPSPHWTVGRVALLGDAAHPMTFNVGQGACMAIEDAACLARVLGGATGTQGALVEYAQRRTARTTPMVNLAWRIGRLASWSNPIACRLRDVIMRGMFAGPALKAHLADMAYVA